MMIDIMMAISENKININNVNSHTNKDKVATIHLGLDITNTSQLDAIMSRIKRIQGVYRVERMTAGTGEPLAKKKKK